MTIINQTELDQLTGLDQVLMWSIISINSSNLDPRNQYVSDNAAIREESKDYINWYVTQDELGNGRFVFSALLPIINPNPLQDKQSIIERIWSFSPFESQLNTEANISGYGWMMPPLPDWIDSTERLLAFVAIIGSKISKYARMTKGNEQFWTNIKSQYWADCKYQMEDSPYSGQMTVTGYLTIDHDAYVAGKSLIRCLNPYAGHANDINCNFPNLMQLWNVGIVDIYLPVEELKLLIPSGQIGIEGGDTADSLIDSYGGTNFIDAAVPDWYTNALEGYQGKSEQFSNTSADIGNATPKIFESLPLCKEQDPDVASFTVSLADKIKVDK